jgi:hypothetical protein
MIQYVCVFFLNGQKHDKMQIWAAAPMKDGFLYTAAPLPRAPSL